MLGSFFEAPELSWWFGAVFKAQKLFQQKASVQKAFLRLSLKKLLLMSKPQNFRTFWSFPYSYFELTQLSTVHMRRAGIDRHFRVHAASFVRKAWTWESSATVITAEVTQGQRASWETRKSFRRFEVQAATLQLLLLSFPSSGNRVSKLSVGFCERKIVQLFALGIVCGCITRLSWRWNASGCDGRENGKSSAHEGFSAVKCFRSSSLEESLTQFTSNTST